MTKAKTDQLFALRDFTDAGTEKSYAQGAAVDATEGELANYQAAGLVGPKADIPPASSAEQGQQA